MSAAVAFMFPSGGHVIPSLPIVAELVRRGERIEYFATPEYQAAVTATGAVFRDYGAGFPLAHPPMLKRMQRNRSTAIQVQLETSCWVLEHFAAELAAARPAYVLYDALTAWGWYMTQALRLPAVSLVPTFVYIEPTAASRPVPLAARARDVVRYVYQTRSRALAQSLSARYHLPPVGNLNRLMQSRGDLNLVFTSRELQPNSATLDPSRFKFIGPSVTPRADTTAFPFDQLDSRPLLLISLGTAFNNSPAFYAACYRAFAGTSYQVVMAVGTQTSLAGLPPAPPNFIVRPFVPQLELLARASVFISHGGMNSVNEALYYNVPLVMLPQAADQGWIAARVTGLGAGIRLPKAADAAQLARAVEQIQGEPRYRAKAIHLGASLRATGGAPEAAQAIMRLAS